MAGLLRCRPETEAKGCECKKTSRYVRVDWVEAKAPGEPCSFVRQAIHLDEDKDDVALDPAGQRRQLPEINPAQPVLGNLKLHRGRPLAFAQIILAHRRIGGSACGVPWSPS